MTKVLGVIPARLESERLRRKLLRAICGHPMIDWVYHRASQATCLDRLLVATDSEEIFNHCRQNQIPVTMTSSAHGSGAERIVEVMARERAEIYVNIQGDEPMVTAVHVELLLGPFRQKPETQVSTLKVVIGREEVENPNNVKVVTDSEGLALYFSRAAIPYHREDGGHAPYYKHLGFYAYRAAALERFHYLPASPLEQTEKLEQLRFLENGIPISVVEASMNTIGVDTEDDLRRVEEYFRASGAVLPAREARDP